MNPLPKFEYSAAVKDHTPPFHQYLDENDEPVINLDLPTIDVIGNGIYRRYPTVTDRDDKKVETGKKTYFNMPKTTMWDSIKTFHITYGVHIARKMQFNQDIHVRTARPYNEIRTGQKPMTLLHRLEKDWPETASVLRRRQGLTGSPAHEGHFPD